MQFSAAKFLFNETEFHRKNAEIPSSPFAPNVILISEKLVERLQNGSVGKEDGKEDTKEDIKEDGKEDTEEDDRYWAEKLATLDEKHTKRNKLCVNDTEKLFRSVVNYARRTHAKLCPLDQTKVRDCYINNRCHTLQCTTEVDNFINCVNKTFYKFVRTDPDLYPSNKKYTYTERFKREI